MELEKDPLKRKIILESYMTLLEKNITRSNKPQNFIGGMPITLERKDMLNLVSKNSQKNYRYSVTQKVDGTRMFMFVGPVLPEFAQGSQKLRSISFIDRENNIYSLKNTVSRGGKSVILELPQYTKGQLLIDGELVFFDEKGHSYAKLDSHLVKGISFMAFDIIYGPISLELEGLGKEKKLESPSEGAMAGPVGGPMWTYLRRWEILHKLIIPSELNIFKPPLTILFQNTQWFNIELKPLYFINSLEQYGTHIYLSNHQGGLQKDLSSSRRGYYKMLHNDFKKSPNVFIKSPVKLDGLIFTPLDAEYVIGSWKLPGNIQYKWKPTDEQSIDFLIDKPDKSRIVKISDSNKKITEYYLVSILISKGQNNFEPFIIKGQEIKGLIPLDKYSFIRKIIIVNGELKSFTIGEFIFKDSNFILKNFRFDKKKPNALMTALNVWKSIQFPVNINDLNYFLNIDKISHQSSKIDRFKMKTVLSYVDSKNISRLY